MVAVFLVAFLWSVSIVSSSLSYQEKIENLRRKFNESEFSMTWDGFKSRAGKSYNNRSSENFRRLQFDTEQKRVKNHNVLFKNGKSDFYAALNRFSDMTENEKNQLLGLKKGYAMQETLSKTVQSVVGSSPIQVYKADSNIRIPAAVDYTVSGWNEPVRDQGQCGSCWAFATTSVMSFYQFNTTKLNYILSPQNLVDCSGSYGNYGCDGGFPIYAFKYMIQKKIALESNYKYKGRETSCKFSRGSPLLTAKSYVQISQDQNSLKQAVAKLGAVVVGIDANLLFNYGGGIWDGSFGKSKCDASELNHAVTVVGYGSSSSQIYWLIKNSWGKTWGEDGFFRMKMDGTNLCGILTEASILI